MSYELGVTGHICSRRGHEADHTEEVMSYGLLVKPGDSEALALALRRLQGSPTLREKYGENARVRMIKEFNQRDIEAKIDAVYQTLLHRIN